MPSLPYAISTRKAMMIATITARPDTAVAWMSIFAKRSSRPSPRRPRMVSLRPPRRTASPNTARMANEMAPPPGSPPIAWAAKNTTPRNTAKSGRNHLDLSGLRRSVGIEDLGNYPLTGGCQFALRRPLSAIGWRSDRQGRAAHLRPRPARAVRLPAERPAGRGRRGQHARRAVRTAADAGGRGRARRRERGAGRAAGRAAHPARPRGAGRARQARAVGGRGVLLHARARTR